MSQIIKCVTWNILAQRYLKQDQISKDYQKDFEEGKFEWSTRQDLIVAQLLQCDAELIFLQEVELNDFESSLFAKLAPFYEMGCHYVNKKRTNPIGNVTLWRPSKIHLKKIDDNSCSIYAEFQLMGTEIQFWALNLHLKSGLRSCRQERLNQVNSCLKLINPNLPGFITGDFNDDLNPNNGSTLVERFAEWNIQTPGITCMNLSRHTGEFEQWSFDHVISSPNLPVTVKPTQIQEIIPSPREPSDHLAVCFKVDIAN